MRIEIKARKVAVTDDLRKRVEKRFDKIAKQVSPLAELEVELSEDTNPRISNSQICEATLRLKGTTLRAKGAAPTGPVETDTHPTAAFALSTPATIAPRSTARGRLTLHGRTSPIAVELQSARAGMQPPSVAGVASVRDHGRMEVRLLLR